MGKVDQVPRLGYTSVSDKHYTIINIYMHNVQYIQGVSKKTLFRDFWPLKLNKNG